MLEILKTLGSSHVKIEKPEVGAWVNLCDPTQDELHSVSEALGADMDFLRAALDEEETARIEYKENSSLIIVDIPVLQPEEDSFLYSTLPLGIILTENNLITVCLKESSILEDFMNGKVRTFDTCKRTRFLLQILFKISSKYLMYLRHIDKTSTRIEHALHKSMKNSELIQMLRLEKSLVFFATSLKANEIVLEKIMRSSVIKRFPDDTDLLEDVIIENKQAIEMCTIYRDILSGTMDAFASVISNNLNIVMKLLASITIIIAVPTLFASLWGMNVDVPFINMQGGFWAVLGISTVVTGFSTWILWKKKMI